MANRTQTIGVVGIDGSGKSTVIRRMEELSPFPRGSVVPWTCPTYHATPDLPFADLSRRLDALSKCGDALGSFGLKTTAMYLQMTLYGPIERFLVHAHEPRVLVSEHHATVDTLAYGAFYKQMVTAPLERAGLEGRVRDWLGARDTAAFDAIVAWQQAEERRRGRSTDFWSIGFEVAQLFFRPEAEIAAELASRYRSGLPDVVVVLDVPVELALERLEARGESQQRELHESKRALELLRQSYVGLAGALSKRGGTTVHVVDTATRAVDDTIAEIFRIIEQSGATA